VWSKPTGSVIAAPEKTRIWRWSAWANPDYLSTAARKFGVQRTFDGVSNVGRMPLIAIFPWMRGSERRGVNVGDHASVKRWLDEISSRPAVQRGVQVLQEVQAAAQAPHDDKSWEIMFGKVQFQKH